jgi:hypothetical protein
MITRILCAVVLATISITGASARDASDNKPKVTPVFDHALPNVPGKSIKGVLVEYQPDGSTPAHTHAGSAFIYATVLYQPTHALTVLAQSRVVMERMRWGAAINLFHATQQASTIAS